MTLPLEGLRVIAVEHWAAGPYGSGYLADLGVDVIKIESRDRNVSHASDALLSAGFRCRE